MSKIDDLINEIRDIRKNVKKIDDRLSLIDTTLKWLAIAVVGGSSIAFLGFGIAWLF